MGVHLDSNEIGSVTLLLLCSLLFRRKTIVKLINFYATIFPAGSSNTICSYNLLSHGLRDLGSSNNILTGRVLLHTLPPEFKVSGKGLSKVCAFCLRVGYI